MPGITAGAGVDRLAAGPEGGTCEAAARTRAAEHLAPRHEFGERCFVMRRALGLPHDASVPLEAVLLERVQDQRLGTGPGAGRVDVLDAEQPSAACGARVAVAADRGDERAEM